MSIIVVLRLWRGSVATRRGWGARATYATALMVTVSGMLLGYAAADQVLTGSGEGSASAGSVLVQVDAPATRACDYGLLAPGDLTGATTCVLSVTYQGSIPAFLSLTVRIRSKAGSGGHPLYDGTNSSGLTMTISDGHHAFTVPTGPGSAGGPCPAEFTCWTAANDLAASYDGGTPSLVFHSGNAATFTLTPLFLAGAGNDLQGAQADVVLSVDAVQAAANPPPPACDATTIGEPCPASGTFTWS